MDTPEFFRTVLVLAHHATRTASKVTQASSKATPSLFQDLLWLAILVGIAMIVRYTFFARKPKAAPEAAEVAD